MCPQIAINSDQIAENCKCSQVNAIWTDIVHRICLRNRKEGFHPFPEHFMLGITKCI